VDEAVLLQAPRTYHCPNCQEAARTVTAKVPWHRCKGLAGLVAPLIADGQQPTRVVVVDREDYVGAEDVQVDGRGRPVMALDVQRRDGSNDRVVYAPTATASAEDLEEASSG